MLPLQLRDNAPSQLRSSYGTKMMPLSPRQHNSPKRKEGNERITGSKARGLQTEEMACKGQTFLSLLSGRRKKRAIFFPSLYKFKRRFLLKFCVAIVTPGFTRSLPMPFSYGNVSLKLC